MPYIRYMDSNSNIHDVDYTVTPIDLTVHHMGDYSYSISTTATTSGEWRPMASGVYNYVSYMPTHEEVIATIGNEETYPVAGGIYEDTEKEIPPI